MVKIGSKTERIIKEYFLKGVAINNNRFNTELFMLN
jgi:hypothetical protein